MTFAFGPRFLDNPNRTYREANDGDPPPGDPPPADPPADGPPPNDPPPADPPSNGFPEDWRNKLVGELPEDADEAAKEAHEKALTQLGRFQSPSDVYKSFREAQNKIAEGLKSQQLPKDATEEQIKQYREANGIPDSPEGYIEQLGDLSLGERDKPIVDSFLKEFAHPKNLSPEIVKDLLTWQQKNEQAQMAAFDEANTQAQIETTAALQEEWQKEFAPNVTRINNLLAMGGEEFANRIANATLDNGVSLFNDKDTMKVLLSWAAAIDPLPTSVGGAGANVDTITEELSSIDKKMGTKAYQNDEKMQARYRELVTAYGKLSGKTWGS